MAKKSRALAAFAKTISVKTADGDVSVPVSDQENRMLNCVLVSSARAMVQEQMTLVRNLGQPLQPKELKDLIAAIRDLVEASGEAYKTLDGEIEEVEGERKAEKIDEAEVDFSDIVATPVTETPEPNDRPEELPN